MSVEKSRAIILKKQRLRETSVLATFYTEDFGKISGVMKGVRGGLNKTYNSLELYSLSEIIFYKKNRGGLYTVGQCDLIDYFKEIRIDYEKTIYAFYFIELLNAITINEDKNEELFRLILKTLFSLKKNGSPAAVKNIYEIKTLILSGFKPRVDSCIICARPVSKRARFSTSLGGLLCDECFSRDRSSLEIYNGTLATMLHIEKADFDNVWRLNLTSKVRGQLSKVLSDFISFHINTNIKSKSFVEAIT